MWEDESMRLRRKPGIENKLKEYGQIVMMDEQTITPEDWKEIFPNDNPINVELGAGKGDFITALATMNPDINYIAMERVPEVLYSAVKKWESLKEIKNIRFLYSDVEKMQHYFFPGQIDIIYLNFSDPWPKKRHAKRRLTSDEFLKIYKALLKSGGEIHLKTDNRDFFEYSLESFADNGFSLRKINYDLHNSNNIHKKNKESSSESEYVMTEYEKRFMSLGQPICRCEAIK